MEPNVKAAILMMIVALPTMFIVIGLFIYITNILVKAFPAENDE